MILSLQSPAEYFRQQLRQYSPRPLSPLVEAYLVEVLCSYVLTDKLFINQSAFYFFEQWLQTEGRPAAVKDLADKLLILNGMFPGHFHNRLLSIEFYQTQGQQAYAQVYRLTQGSVFAELAASFPEQVKTLSRVREASAIAQLVSDPLIIFSDQLQ